MVSEKGQLLNNGQNWCSHFVLYSEVRLYMYIGVPIYTYYRSYSLGMKRLKKCGEALKSDGGHMMQGHFNHGERHEWHFVSFGTPYFCL